MTTIKAPLNTPATVNTGHPTQPMVAWMRQVTVALNAGDATIIDGGEPGGVVGQFLIDEGAPGEFVSPFQRLEGGSPGD